MISRRVPAAGARGAAHRAQDSVHCTAPAAATTAAAVAARFVAGLAALLFSLPAAAAGCEPHLRGGEIHQLAGKRYALAWRAVPAIRVGEFFTLDVAVCANDGQPRIATLRVDAAMPAHDHGMNYRASVRPQGTDRFVVEGLMWHMPGTWELRFEINAGADRESLVATVPVD